VGVAPADLWAAFLASGTREAAAAARAGYTAWHFGAGGQIADDLVELVLSGRKRATAGASWSYENEDEPLPQVGDFSVITDGSGSARCVIRTTAVDVVPFSEVSAEFAAAEGEGDLSLEYWREGHWRYLGLELVEFGRRPQPDMPVVCERFELLYTAGGDAQAPGRD
jgi:uncharacterized protein YhfF